MERPFLTYYPLKVICLWMLFLLGSLSIQAQHYSYESVENDPMQSRIYTLRNGLKIYLTVNKEKPRIQTYIAVRTGSRNDPKETTGLAHYLEHLMFKGTTHFGTSDLEAERPYLDSIESRFEQYRHITDPLARKTWYHQIDSISQLAARYNIPNEYDKMMTAIGSEGSNAYTSNDVTCYEENIPANELDTWAKVQADRFQNMVIRGFHTELEAVYEEYNIGLANDARKLFAAGMAKMFPNHPYGTQTTIGLGEHLKNPSITNIKNYFKQYYVPNNVAICLSGDLSPDKTVAVIDKYFGGWKESPDLQVPQYAPLAPLTASVDTTVVGQETPMVYIGWRAEAANTLQGDTLDVINQMLCNGKAGLFDLNLTQKMLLLNADDSYDQMNDYSGFFLYGVPKEGQTLKEVRDLLLAQIEELKQGHFSDDLLPSVINNYKRDFYTQLDNNEFRANMFVDAFINHKDWKQVTERLDRLSRLTKDNIVNFAKRFFRDNFICVYKEQGIDSTIKKVEKPSITPIPTNNDKHSTFLQEVVNTEPEPIQPQFVDYRKDMTETATKRGVPLLYRQNTADDLFNLRLIIPTGTEDNPELSYAADYLGYLGTDKLSNGQIKQQFYKLACDYSIYQTDDETTISLQGLNENLPQALTLLTNIIEHAKADKEAYSKYIDLVIKSRNDSKANQRENFNALLNYGIYGKYNATRNIPSAEKLRGMDPEELLEMVRSLLNSKMTILYYGPMELKTLDRLVSKNIKTPKQFVPQQASLRYVAQSTEQNEVLIAPYDAKNIYMVQFHNENKEWTADEAPVIALFNEYFGGGMNAIVFQELREARGLAYSARAHYNQPYRKTDRENFNTLIITQNDKMMDCIHEFNNLINNVPERQAGFDLAKQSLMKSLATERTTKFSILTSYMAAKKLGLDYSLNEKIYKSLPSIRLQDLISFEKTNIANKPFKYIILGNEKELDLKALEKIAPITRLSTEEIFGY